MFRIKNDKENYTKRFNRIVKFKKKLNTPKSTRRGGWKF